MTDAATTFTTEVLRTPAQWSDRALAAAWTELCRRHGGLEVLFQSPEWFAHLGRTGAESGRRVIVVRDQRRDVVALGALYRQDTELKFDVGATQLCAFRLPGMVLLGGEPLAPPERAVHDAFFAALADELSEVECLAMPMVEKESLFRRHLGRWAQAQHRFFLYAPAMPGAGQTHSLTLESTFDEYAKVHFSAKQRSSMKRHVKLLERELGTPELRRFRAPDEVDAFLAAAREVSKASWQYATVGPHFETSENWEEKLADLASRGVLRSYLLYAGGRPLAFVLGYQHGDVFYHVKTGYDRSVSKLAPGITVLRLILEELGKTGRTQRLSFMFGDADYKRDFANVHVRTDELMLLRRTPSNVLRWGSHAAFRAGVTFARSQVRRLAPLRRPRATVDDTRG